MDNKKIGKLIADLRKKKGLTQQELGDRIGVGFRAVSKWERGITLPDIANINELSKILGITSDELLSGELSKENKNKDKKKLPPIAIKISIAFITIIAIFTAIFIYYNNKDYVYNISSSDDEYYIEGQVIFKNDNLSIIVNKFDFTNPELSSTVIKNYEYKVSCGEETIIRYGYIDMINNLGEPTSIKKLTEKFTINYNGKTKVSRTKILTDSIVINFVFLDEFNNEITKEIKILINQLSENNEK